MGMTMTQKILARHAGLEHVVPGQLVEGKLDLVLATISPPRWPSPSSTRRG